MTNRMTQARKTVLLCLVCTFFWGIGYPVLKMSYGFWAIASSDVVGKLLFAGIRFFLAGVVLLVVASLRKKQVALPAKAAMPRVAILGLCQTTFQYGLLYIGLANTSGSKGSVLNQVSIFLSVLLTPLFFKSEKITLRKVLGCLFGFSGIILMNLDGLSFHFEFGDMLVVSSSCCAAVGYLISKGMPSGSDALTSTAWQQMFGGFVLIVLGVLTGGKLTVITTSGVLCFSFMVLAAAVSYSIWFYLLQYNDVGKISISKFLTPIFGVVFSGILLGETIFSVENIIALILVCVGIFVVNAKKGIRA